MEASQPQNRSVGSILRSARESKDVTLEAIAAATHIRLGILRDLEADKLDSLPPKVYITGFIKNYCSFLDIDFREAIEAHRRQTANPTVELMPDTSTPVGTGKAVSQRSLILLLGTLGALVLATNLWFRNYQSPSPSPAPTPTPISMMTNTRVALPAFNSSPPDEQAGQHPLVFEVIAEMNLTIQASVDDKPVFSGFMNPGQRKLWNAAKSVSLITDNAGGLRIVINGQTQGQLGRVGERFEHRWETR